MTQAEELVQVVGARVITDEWWKLGEVTVNGEAKGTADGGNTANDVCTINGGGVPGINCTVGCFRGDLGVSGALVDGNLESFVEEPEEVFNRDRLVVAFDGWVAGEVEGFAHAFEVFFEG